MDSDGKEAFIKEKNVDRYIKHYRIKDKNTKKKKKKKPQITSVCVLPVPE